MSLSLAVPEAIEDSPEFLNREMKTELNKLLLAFETTMFAFQLRLRVRRRRRRYINPDKTPTRYWVFSYSFLSLGVLR